MKCLHRIQRNQTVGRSGKLNWIKILTVLLPLRKYPKNPGNETKVVSDKIST